MKNNLSKRVLSMLISLLLVVSIIPIAVLGAPSEVTLTLGELLSYGDNIEWKTHYMEVDGVMAYCANPSKKAPEGTFTSTEDVNDPNIIKAFYYGYGGIGFETTLSGIGMSIKELCDKLKIDNVLIAPIPDLYSNMTHRVIAKFDGADDYKHALTQDWIDAVDEVASAIQSAPNVDNFGLYRIKSTNGDNQDVITYYPVGGFELIKASANEAITNGNDCYSLEGAEYDVFNMSGEKVGTIITNAEGKGSLTGLRVGKYKIKETKAPKGYALDPKEYEVTISSAKVTRLEVKDIPQNDPVAILLRKVDNDTGEANTRLANAEFTIKYYDGYYSTEAEINSKTPNKTWVFKTDEDGYIFLYPEYLVSGDSFYYSSSGNSSPALPLGTLRIEETKAPQGYLKSNEIFIIQITSEGQSESVRTYNAPIVKETAIKGGVAVEKWDSELNQANSQGDATLEGTIIDIYNSENQVVETLTTDALGKAKTADDALLAGNYKAKERKAPDGYLNNGITEQSFSIDENNTKIVLTGDKAIKNNPIRGGVKIKKDDNETGSNPQGNADLKDTIIDIYNRSAKAVMVGGKLYQKDEIVATLTTNDDGIAQTSNDFFPYGKYEAIERTAPNGYLNKGIINQLFTISESGKIVELTGETAIKNDVIRGGFEIEKLDIELNLGIPQGNATLENAEFDIYNRSNKAVLVDGKLFQPNELICTVSTGENGMVKSSDNYLAYGDYQIIERKAPTGYLNKGIINQSFSIREDRVIVKLTGEKAIKNNPIRGGVQIEKWDNETNSNTPQGNATLENAVIDIYNRSKYPVLVDGELYQPDEVVVTLKTDKDGKISTSDDFFPYGKYETEEKTAPTGYLNKGKISQIFEITTDKEIIILTGETAIKNDVIRGDLKGIKISDGDMKRMANVPFKITSKTTGESHIIVTDINGMFDTSSNWNPHSQNTNRGETSEDGIWFGELSALDDEKGALLYDTYLIEELPCEANADRKIIEPFEVKIYRNMTVVDLGTITNDYEIIPPPPEIRTKARDKATGTNQAYASKTTTIIDTVSYTGLIIGKEYNFEGILMNKETGEPLLIDGKTVTAEDKFIAETEDGTRELFFTFDSSALIGKSVVVFENLYQEGIEIAVHADINDEGQTVTFKDPKLRTKARDKATGTNQAYASKTTTIIDTVSYTGLIIGKEYNFKGILMDKSTGFPLLINGKPVTHEEKLIAEQESGTIDLLFTFDSSTLAGKSIVVFEALYFEGIEIAIHADINDEGQTVTFEEPQTPSTPSTPQPPRVSSPPKTGQSAIIIYVILLILTSSLAFIIAGLVANKKKKGKERN